MVKRTALMVVMSLCGCATVSVTHDGKTSCDILRDNPRMIDSSSSRERVFLALNTPAEHAAKSAHAQRIATIVLGTLGAGALAAGFIEGFIVNSASDSSARQAGYGLVGGAIGTFAIATALGVTSAKETNKARAKLKEFASSCSGN